MTVALIDQPPRKVQHMVKQKVEIIQSPYIEIVQDRYDKFLNYVMSWGAKIHGSQLTVTINELFVIAVYYEVPINVTDEIIGKAYEK